MNYEVDDSESVQALDHNQQAQQREFGVDNGCDVTINTGNLGTGNNALTVAAGDVMFNGSSVSVASQSVDIDLGDAKPRKDIVYIDSTGSAVVSKGAPEKAYPSNTALGPFEYQRPAPNDLMGTDAVVLYSVWVGASASTVSSSELRDRRVSSRGSYTSVDTEKADITEMTYIEADRGSANTGVSAGTWGGVVNRSQVDNLNELDSNGQFSPSETGRYNIEGLCVISGGGTADAVAVRVYNMTDSVIVRDSTRLTNIDVSNGFIKIPLTLTAQFEAGKTYEVQVTDETSSFNIDGGEVTITRSVVHG